MAVSQRELNNRLQTISKSFQDSLNTRLDGMIFDVTTGSEYDISEHQDNIVYFVKRDEETYELWKGDIQISGQGGDGYEVTNALLLESSSVSAVTGGANGEIFMTVVSGDDSSALNTPTYGEKRGQFRLTTRGKQDGANWVSRNTPASSFNILYQHQVASANFDNGASYISTEKNVQTRYPKYVLTLCRGINTPIERLELYVCQLSCHTSCAPTWASPNTYVDFPTQDTYDDFYDFATINRAVSFRTMIFAKRFVNDTLHSSGYYYSTYCGGHRGVQSILSVNIKNIHYDSELDKVVGTPYIYPEYSKQDSICGQLGLRRDIVTGGELGEPLVIFNPQNEFIMYKLLKGESIT